MSSPTGGGGPLPEPRSSQGTDTPAHTPPSSRVTPGTGEKQIQGAVEPALTQGEFDARKRAQQLAAAKQKLKNRKWVANGALLLMVFQVLAVDAMVAVIAWKHDWTLSDGVFKTWLWATVVQIISIVAVVTGYLFPKGAPDDLSMSEEDH